ncbi:MAG: response regulator [Mucilaginibacter sp.]
MRIKKAVPVNILIVDDREENIIALTALLERDDIHLFSTTSTNEGLKLAWENEISIAMIDVQMPEMDGFEFVKVLKSNPRTEDILVIFVTAISKESKYAVMGFDAGAIDYLYKPLDPAITKAKVDSFIQLANHRAAMRQKNEELENMAVVVKNSADIICTVNARTLLIQNINQAVEKILDFQPGQLVGKSIIDFAVDEEKDALQSKLNEIINNKLSYTVSEFQFYKSNKTVIWAECRATYQNKTLFLNISDITAQKSYENELIRSKEHAENARKIKETFVAHISHELRTPLNGILGIVNLLRTTAINEQQRSLIDLLDVSSQSLIGVINDVLDISKIDAGKFKIVRAPVNLTNLIKAVYGLLKFKADENNIAFNLEIDDDLPSHLMIDALRLNQVLMNLLSNAIKFTRSGYVTLKVSVLQRHGGNVNLQFSVEDTGIGIAESRLGTIFESFEQAEDDITAKFGGTGLGLAIVKKLVALKGGELTVKSEVGTGSTFTFTNWYSAADAPDDKQVIKDGVVLEPFSNVNILVAEDNLINQFMLAKMLRDWKIKFVMVDNGRKVLEKVKAENYDLILMDTHMPELNGYETTRAIRNDFDEPKRSVPIISLSAAVLDYEQQEAILAGMNDVLSKPFQPYQLHSKIKNLLGISAPLKSPA